MATIQKAHADRLAMKASAYYRAKATPKNFLKKPEDVDEGRDLIKAFDDACDEGMDPEEGSNLIAKCAGAMGTAMSGPMAATLATRPVKQMANGTAMDGGRTLAKSYVHTHTRTLKSGKVITIGQYNNKTQAGPKHAPHSQQATDEANVLAKKAYADYGDITIAHGEDPSTTATIAKDALHAWREVGYQMSHAHTPSDSDTVGVDHSHGISTAAYMVEEWQKVHDKAVEEMHTPSKLEGGPLKGSGHFVKADGKAKYVPGEAPEGAKLASIGHQVSMGENKNKGWFLRATNAAHASIVREAYAKVTGNEAPASEKIGASNHFGKEGSFPHVFFGQGEDAKRLAVKVLAEVHKMYPVQADIKANTGAPDSIASASDDVKAFVDFVKNGGHGEVTFNLVDGRKAKEIEDELGEKFTEGAPEILIKDCVIHASNHHPDLTTEDWAKLPFVANNYDAVFLSKVKGRNQENRLVFVMKDGDDHAYVYVAEAVKSKKDGNRLKVTTFYRDHINGVIANLKKSAVNQERVKDFAAGGDSSLARLSPSYYPDPLDPNIEYPGPSSKDDLEGSASHNLDETVKNELPAHLAKMADKLDMDKINGPKATVTDVTPAGYGPGEDGPQDGDQEDGLTFHGGRWHNDKKEEPNPGETTSEPPSVATDTGASSEAPPASMPTPAQMVGIGGKEWEKNGKKRIYFNKLGEYFPENPSLVAGGKFWYDHGDKQFHAKELDDYAAKELELRIKAKAHGWTGGSDAAEPAPAAPVAPESSEDQAKTAAEYKYLNPSTDWSWMHNLHWLAQSTLDGNLEGQDVQVRWTANYSQNSAKAKVLKVNKSSVTVTLEHDIPYKNQYTGETSIGWKKGTTINVPLPTAKGQSATWGNGIFPTPEGKAAFNFAHPDLDKWIKKPAGSPKAPQAAPASLPAPEPTSPVQAVPKAHKVPFHEREWEKVIAPMTDEGTGANHAWNNLMMGGTFKLTKKGVEQFMTHAQHAAVVAMHKEKNGVSSPFPSSSWEKIAKNYAKAAKKAEAMLAEME